MTKKRFSKLLSVILALAICATTVFGCLITANAATPCYAWSDGKVADDGQTATINLTITAPDGVFDAGFLVGKFELAQDAALTPESVTVVDGTSASGSFDVGNVTANLEGNVCDFYNNVGQEDPFKTLVFKITYKAAFEKGKEYEVNVTSMELADSYDKYTENASGKAGVIRMGCDHVVSVDGLTRVATQNGYSVYENAVCAKCGENIGYQLVPTESLTKPNVVYLAADYDTPDTVTFEGDGSEATPYIIDTVGKLRSLVQAKTDITQNTAGKFFKIADDIDIICLQRQSYMDANGGLDAFMAKSADEVKTFFESNTSGRTNWNSASGSFAGTIDFNGVTIVGAYAVNGGLFENVRVGATIKNLNLTHNYFTHGDKTGSVVGYVPNPGAENVGTVTFDTIIIHDNALVSTNTSAALERTGVLMAFAYDNVAVKYSNLLTYGNKATGGNIGEDVALIGFLSTGWNGLGSANPNGDYNTSVILDCVPYPISAVNNQGTRKEYWHSIYTNGNIDAYKANYWAENSALDITKITTSAASGLNALSLEGLDFVNTWHFDSNGGYPSPVKTEDVATVSQSALNFKAVNLTYATDGTFDINFYYEPVEELSTKTKVYETTKVYAGVADGSALYESQGVVVSDADCETLGLKSGTLCYSVKSIPARKIGDLILPTVVAKNVGTTIWGATKQLSVADYAKAVIDGDGIYYPDNATEEQKAQDKAVAAAVINYGAAAKNALAVTSTGVTKNVIYLTSDYNTPESVTFAGSGTEAEPYIIDTVGKLRALAQSKIEAAQNTAGKFYKIADGISTICLQTKSYIDANGGLDKFMAKSADEIKDLFETNTSGRTNWNSAGDAFAGTIDFNGATVVGAYGVHGGLFEKIAVGSTIKNLTLANNYFTNSINVGSVAAYIQNPSAAGTATFESIIIKNNALVSTNSSAALERTGVLVGYAAYGNIGLKYSNLLTYGNKATGGNIGADVALVGAMNASTNGLGTANPNGDFNTSVILDCVPYQINSTNNQTTRKEYWHSIYTNGNIDAYKANSWAENSALDITKLSDEDVAKIKGEAADKHSVLAKLDFDTAWITGYPDEYPTPAQKGIESETTNVVYLAADYDTPDTVTFEGDGSEATPYIIDTVGKLRSLVQAKTDITQNTAGKFFKIADDIDIICLQRQSYMDANGGLDAFMAKSADEVKTFFESNTSGRTNWNSASGSFAGTIDFNGVTIVGAYAVNGGLFENVRVGATIKNLNLTHNYFTHGDKTGSVVGYVPNPGAENVGTVTFDTIIIHDNALVSTNTSAALERTGVLMAFAYDNVAVKYSNLLTYGNKATGGNIGEDVALIGFLSTGWNGLGSANPNGDYNTSVILDCVPYPISAVNNQGTRKEYWHSIYTNGNIDAYKANYWAENSALDITKISADEVKGDNAKTLMDKLGWGYDGNGAWYTGNAWGYPSFEKASVMPEAYQSAYEGMSLDGYMAYGDSTAQFGFYSAAVGLMSNPYIGLSFAFGKEGDVNYKADRANINVKVTDANGVEIYNGNPPAYTQGEYIENNNGWTNKENAGRYHLLRLDGKNGIGVIAAKDLYKDVTITVTYGEKTVNATFNLAGFARELEDSYKKTGSEYYLVRAEAVKAVIYYSQMLDARY